MIAFSIILFAVGAIFLILGVLIYRGKTNLIHSYHQNNINTSDSPTYGKSFSKAMFCITITLTTSGVIALFGNSKSVTIASLAVLFVGLIVSFAIIANVQKKFNGGIF